ncbi:MAG: bifunctional ornithine acetyltransferase/N-acetylglutamate synthase [Chloroflexota bacterium]
MIDLDSGLGADDHMLRPLEAIPSDLPDVEAAARLPRGFRVAGTHAGIKASGDKDLGLVLVEGDPAAVATTFTTNRLPAAPVQLNQEHLAESAPSGDGRYGWASAMIATSGCANAATGPDGLADQCSLAFTLAAAARTKPSHTLAMSTGLIGTRLPVERVAAAITATISDGLGDDDRSYADLAEALRTTDSRAKAAAVSMTLPAADGTPVAVTISGVAKGVGMIHPGMATMLCFMLTDASVEPAALHRMLRPVVAHTWDQISVDGDQSTNDTVLVAASGASGAMPLVAGSDDEATFARALQAVARSLARQQVADGEGAATLIGCVVSGATDDVDARAAARKVIASSLVKTAIHGADPNWGRIAAAVGNARAAPPEVLAAAGLDEDAAQARGGRPIELRPERLRIDLQGVPVFGGGPIPFDEPALSERMRRPEVLIRIDLGLGGGQGEAFGCDLTERYVIENSEYST